MVRKANPGKSAAKKADAKKHTASKPSTRSALGAKAVVRKGQAAKVQAKHVAKAVSAKVAEQAKKAATPAKKPVAAVAKAAPAKAHAGVPHPAKSAAPMPSPAIKNLLHKGVVAKAQTAPAHPTAVRRLPAAMSKQQSGQAIVAPAAPKPGAQKPAVPAPAAAQPAANKKPVSQRHGFKTNEWIVYPAHGVGRIVGIEEQEIAGMSLELFVITFEKDKMTLRVPTGKSASVGMRKLADENIVKRAMETLKGRARIKRTMWSRRAQEYEAKINSGDLISIAEVVRDLYRSESQPEQSYSERQLYEAALDRMAREIAAVEKLDERGAVQRITEVLSKSAKGRRLAAEEAEVKAA
jgi:CarD family transcriptional regulator